MSGYLLQWEHWVKKTDLLEQHHLHFRSRVGSTSWEIYSFDSPIPLLRGEQRDESKTEYTYGLLCRRSGPKLLVLSAGREVIEHIMSHAFNEMFSPSLQQVHIDVDSLVKKVTLTPREYVLSFAHARIPAYGANLRSVSFYGDDLANANFFIERISLMTFFTCGLRLASGGNEIIRLGSEGSVSFIPSDIRRMLEVERALRFLRDGGYLSSTEIAVEKFENADTDDETH